MKTSFLLASPKAEGLLHRAAVQSGPGLRIMERDQSARITEALLQELGIKSNSPHDVQRVPVAQLLAAHFAVRAKFPDPYFTDLNSFAPLVDGHILPRHPFDPDAPSLATSIPLLIGWNRTEMTFFMGADSEGFALGESGLRNRLDRFLGAHAEEGLQIYRKRFPDFTPFQLYIQIWSDFSIMRATLQQAERKAAHGGAPTYVYRFDWATPVLGGKLGSPHSIENAFVWNNTEGAAFLTGGGPVAAQLASHVSRAWMSFA